MKTSIAKHILTIALVLLATAPIATKADTSLSVDTGSAWDYNVFADTNFAQKFTMGATSYNLTSVSLDVCNASNSFSDFSIGIYSDIAGFPGSLISALKYSSKARQIYYPTSVIG